MLKLTQIIMAEKSKILLVTTKENKQHCIEQSRKKFGDRNVNAYIEYLIEKDRKAPEMLDFLIELYNDKETHSGMFPSQQSKLKQLIKEATEI